MKGALKFIAMSLYAFVGSVIAASMFHPHLAGARQSLPAERISAEDRAEVSELIARYALFWEFRRCDDWASLFAKDGSFFDVKGRTALAMKCRAPRPTPHIHAQINTALGRVSASKIRGVTNVLLLQQEQGADVKVAGYGDYHDVFVKTPEGWRLQSRYAVRHLEQPLPSEITHELGD